MDRETLSKLRSGDRALFEQLAGEYWETAVRRASSLTRSWQDAEDLVQEAYARAWAKLQDFRGEASFGTWLLRIMENYHIDLQRKRQRQPVVSLEALELPRRLKIPAALSVDLSALEQKWEAEDLRRCLEAALARLPDVYEKLIILRDVHKLSYEEIAEHMACSVESIRCKLYRARRQMRTELSILLGQYGIVT